VILEEARVPCHICGAPVRNTELKHERNIFGDWELIEMFMVCENNHRVPVEKFD
jgi:hypothetical protein